MPHKSNAAKTSAVLLLLAGAVLSIAATAASVVDTTLPNGLRVIVKEDHRAPVMVSQVWYRAGSIDEFNGTTGIAHVLEHMMFKGTKAVPAGEFSRRIAAAGGRENAFTSRDHTAYFQQMQKDRLELSMQLESDRMQNLQITDDSFAKEIQVVMEERRMRTDDNPQSMLSERLMSVAFQESPYRRPIIGWMNDLEHLTAQDARDWYHRWYTPNNATLVVAGDVNAEAVIALAKKYFGTLPSHPLPARRPQDEPPQLGIKRITVKVPAKLPYLVMAYHAPVLRDWEHDWQPYALQILAGVLAGNDSARLQTALVKQQQVAVNADADYDAIARGPGMFALDATPAQGKTVADVEAALRREIERIKHDGVSDAELNRVKSQIVAGDVFQRDSLFYQAMQLGEIVTAGLPPALLDGRVAKLRAITPAQVQAVARTYLIDEELTIGTLDPQPLVAKPPRPAVAGVRND
jgi:zinc protease